MVAPTASSAHFLTSAPTLERVSAAEVVPEVAIAGRSNSGKSSVLNQLTRNRQLARTSKTPGRTQLLNFFETSLGGRLVDLPGYGYARVAKSQKRIWEDNVEEYLAHGANLVALVLVMDIRRPFEPFDRDDDQLGAAHATADARPSEQSRQAQARRPDVGVARAQSNVSRRRCSRCSCFRR